LLHPYCADRRLLSIRSLEIQDHGIHTARHGQKASPATLEMVVQGFEAAGLQALHHGLQIGGIPRLDI
jgi:hypothetical protein